MNNSMNTTVRKIHNLLSSGAVTMTGPNQPRILKQKVSSNTLVSNNIQQQVSANRCYVCDDALVAGQAQNSVTEMQTTHTSTKFPNKIGSLVGEAFTVIISADDVICARCTNLINYLDRLENDVERVRTNLINLLHKKYGLNDEGGGGGGEVLPPKIQKLNSGTTVMRVPAEESAVTVDSNRTRKIVHIAASTDSGVGKQSPPVSAVQQIKISTQPTQQQHLSAGTQTIQRKTTRIYKCLSCEYKTSDMRLFNTHYESCKQQSFQCKNCKKIFPNFGTMKQHMVREHNTSMDNTCSVCHINFVSEGSLRKHMEMNHGTNVVVTTTVPMSAVVNEVANSATLSAATNNAAVAAATVSTPIYTCSQCQFKTTDKAVYDEHLRKHVTTKPKPFKCRLCSQRFETREAATTHAKQHQPNFFRCGTCSLSFSKREQLVKHFEVHQQTAGTAATSVAQQQQHVQQIILSPNTTKQVATTNSQQSQNLLTTQKLLQETIDEALSENVSVAPTAASDTTTAAASNIRFYSCHVCSLTFLQENYYNQHMETHRRDEKKSASSTTTNATSGSSVSNVVGSAASAMGSGNNSRAIKKGDNGVTETQQPDANSAAEADIESIFEKMHSDKGDADTTAAVPAKGGGTSKSSNASSNGDRTHSGAGQDNLVITSQEGSGGITFNITIPKAAATGSEDAAGELGAKKSVVSIDMPTLDQPEEVKLEPKEEKSDLNDAGKTNKSAASAAPVNMPSLDDDGEASEQQAAEAGKSLTDSSAAAVDSTKTQENSKDAIKTESDDAGNSLVGNTSATTAATAGHETIEEHVEHQQSAESVGATDVEGGGGLTAEQLAEAAATEGEHQQVAMELDEAMQAQVESGQIKFILNENGHLLQLDNHIITDADGNQILVQDPEQIQQLLQSVVLQPGDSIDGETLQMMTTDNGQMVLVHGENNETQLIDASLLNAEGQLVIQQGQDGELGEGTHVISEDGTRIPVSVSYTADGQPIVRVQQVLSTSSAEESALEKEVAAAAGETTAEHADGSEAADGSNVATTQASGGTASGGFFSLEDLMQQQQQHSAESKAAE